MIINEHSKDILSVPWTDSRSNEFGIRLNNSDYPFQQKKFSSVRMAWSTCSKKNVICLNSLCYLLNGLGYPFKKKIVTRSNGLGYPFEKKLFSVRKRNCRPFERLKLYVQRQIQRSFYPKTISSLATRVKRSVRDPK